MAKSSGLGDNLYVDGFDLSGDVGSLSSISGSVATLDATDITKSANQRLFGLRDGGLEFTAFFNPLGAHPVLATLPLTDAIATYCRGTTVGAPAACLVGKQVNYDPTRDNAGNLTFKVQVMANGYGLEWGVQLTPGIRTDTAATTGTSLDSGAGFATPAVPASLTPVTNTSSLTATVVITGGTMTNVSVNGVTAGTGAGTYTVPAAGTITLTYTVAPTWAWTLATAFGAQAYLQVFGFTGTDATVKLQHSTDNSTWADLTGGGFTQITASNSAQRIATANTATINRYVRATTITTSGFTSLAFSVMVNVNTIAGVVF